MAVSLLSALRVRHTVEGLVVELSFRQNTVEKVHLIHCHSYLPHRHEIFDSVPSCCLGVARSTRRRVIFTKNSSPEDKRAQRKKRGRSYEGWSGRIMDLPTVKAAVKAWEKAFRASHGRVPTKEDIKSDPSNISESCSPCLRRYRASPLTLHRRTICSVSPAGQSCGRIVLAVLPDQGNRQDATAVVGLYCDVLVPASERPCWAFHHPAQFCRGRPSCHANAACTAYLYRSQTIPRGGETFRAGQEHVQVAETDSVQSSTQSSPLVSSVAATAPGHPFQKPLAHFDTPKGL